jgi:hypothetical protein
MLFDQMSESVEIIRQNLERQENVSHELLKENVAVNVKVFEKVSKICNNIENASLNLGKLAVVEEESKSDRKN